MLGSSAPSLLHYVPLVKEERVVTWLEARRRRSKQNELFFSLGTGPAGGGIKQSSKNSETVNLVDARTEMAAIRGYLFARSPVGEK